MSRRPDRSGRPFSWPVFVLASLAAAAVLVTLVAVPQWLSQQARWEQLRKDVGAIGEIAATTVDGDLHRRLLDPKNYSNDLYKRALEPLVRLHSADPDIYYLYTMVDRGGVAHFILDTASSPDLRTKHELRASAYDETFVPRTVDDWLEQLASGKTYVNEDFEEDDYGTFLTALAPIYDSEGRYSGFCRGRFRYGILSDAGGPLPRHRHRHARRGAAVGACDRLCGGRLSRGDCSGACASFMTAQSATA